MSISKAKGLTHYYNNVFYFNQLNSKLNLNYI